MITDLNFYTDFLIWGDETVIRVLEKISDDEFTKSFGELTGSIAVKAGHLVGIYEFFIQAIKGSAIDHFPSFSNLPRIELLEKWRSSLVILKELVETRKNEFLELPIALGNYVNVELAYVDAIFHSTHHRAQILTFVRLLGKTKEDVHPRETNVDFFNFIMKKKSNMVISMKN